MCVYVCVHDVFVQYVCVTCSKVYFRTLPQKMTAPMDVILNNAHLSTLDPGNEAQVLQLHPVGLVKLWTNQKVQVLYLVIFPDQRGSETKLAMGLNSCGEGRGVWGG